MKKQVTIKEIAQEAGVSIATVSMILNHKDKNISDFTRNKVLKIAKDRNYIPNTIARSMVTRSTRTIGLIIPDIVNPFFPEIARGVEDKAREARYSIIYCNTDDNLDNENRSIDILTEKMVDGIIFAHSADRQGSTSGLSQCRVPIILIDRDYDFPNVKGKVLVDNKKASFIGVSYLLEQGYRNIAYLAGSIHTSNAKDRLEGYKQALIENGIEYREPYVKVGKFRSEWGAQAAKELISDQVPFDAIFCGNDLIAIGAMKALKEAGLQIPKDVGIMGIDDIYMASMVDPALTTIKQPIYDMGYCAAELLIESIENKSEPIYLEENGQNKIILETRLMIRESTK